MIKPSDRLCREHLFPRIVLVFDTSQGFGRGVLRGVANWIQRHDPWTALVDEQGLAAQLPGWLSRGQIDGVISRLDWPQLPAALRRPGLPIVRLASIDPRDDLPGVFSDELAIGRSAADHLIDQGFHELAFCGLATSWSRLRQQGFEEQARARGCRTHVFDRASPATSLSSPDDHAALSSWLGSLPKPVGIMAATDLRGLHVLDACHHLGIGVPDEAAVVGVDNDELVCDLATPTLSSVAQNLERIGYIAAEMLSAMIAGTGAVREKRVFVQPFGVEPRKSTDALTVADPDLRSALRLIRKHACQGIAIEELADQTSLTRRTLERRFQKELGRSIHDEILRVKIAAASRLLADTEHKLQKIANDTGFNDVASLCHAFKRATGSRPGDFRRQCRPWLDMAIDVDPVAADATKPAGPSRRRSRKA